MPSPPAISCDTYYHIYNRGINRENVFFEERNYAYFMALYQKYISPVADTYAYCLLRNHFHLLVRIKTLKVSKTFRVLIPSQQFSNFFNAYAKAINKTHHRSGSLFQHPFGRVPITNTRQFYRVVIYIHQNPQKHGFVEDYRQWPYSSYGILLANNPTILRRDEVMEWFGDGNEFTRLHADWVTEQESAWFAGEDR